MTFTAEADNILDQLLELDAEAAEGIYDPVRLFERTAELVRRACLLLKTLDGATTRVVELTPENCDHNRAVEPDTGECLDCGEILR